MNEKFYFKTSNVLYPIVGLAAVIISIVLAGFYFGKIPLVDSCDSTCKNIGAIVAPIINLFLYALFVKWIFMIAGWGYYYSIYVDGIIVSMFYKKKKFLFSEMTTYYKLSEKQVGDFVYRLNNNMLDYSNWLNPVKQVKLSWKLTMLGKYSGVVFPSASQDTSLEFGNGSVSIPIYMKAVKINPTEGYYVLIVMKNEGMYILSPKNTDKFVEEIDSIAK